MDGRRSGGGSLALAELIDEHGEALYADLTDRGIDLGKVIAGEGPSPRLVIGVIRWLPDTSAFHASQAGGRDFLGWGQGRRLMAATYDAINQQTRATGQWKKDPPDIPPWPTPFDKKKRQEKATVKGLFSRFTTGR